MKPKADEEDILTGKDAIDHAVKSWDNIGLGMVNIEFINPYIIVRRSGGNYSMFLSVVDDTVVTVLDDEATTRHIPDDLRPEDSATENQIETLETAFDGQNGSYPHNDVFTLNFKDGDQRKAVEVGLLTDSFEVVEV